MKTYIWAVDAGHEWLAVKKSELLELGIADKISQYSYEKGGTAYLEGDCDAAVFIDAYTARHGAAPKTKTGKHWDVQPLRRFASYRKPRIAPQELHIFQEAGDTLTDYVNQMNSWNAIFNAEQVTFPLTSQGAQTIASRLDSELSPENLHCDGEISARDAQKKYDFLTLVLDELNLYCDANGLTRPRVYEA